MFLYNTLSGKKEELAKPTGRPLKMFVCGLTVYDYPHIGNGRTFVIFDAFVKYLRSKGWDVFYLQNVTDIDDKIIARAAEEKTTWRKISKKFERIYHRNERQLGIDSVTAYARATDHVKEILRQTEVLMEKGFAYRIEGDGIYFDVSKFPDYGKLSRRTYLDAEDSVSRIDESVMKRHKGDFALWKFSKPGEPTWRAKLGDGRPGWHIEDTAISEKYLGNQYDLHGGGVDLKFPHHEAEIAQAEAASGKKPFVKIWMHSGHLMVNDKKMSKSLGNFVTLDDFLKGHSGNAFRFLVLSHHYRSPMNYTEALVKNSEDTLKSLEIFMNKLVFIAKKTKGRPAEGNFEAEIKKADERMGEFLDDDFNTPGMFGMLFSFVSSLENSVWQLGRTETQLLLKTIRARMASLGFHFPTAKVPLKIKRLAAKRELFRKNKQFVQSDDLRKRIKDLGYSIDDTPLGPFIYRN